MFNHRSVLSLVFLVFFCKLTPSFGQIFTSAQSQGTGEAGRAGYDFVGSHFLNPATLVEQTGYVFGSAYQITRPDSQNPISNTVIVITDNTPSSFLAAGFGYVNQRQSYDDRIITDQDFSLSLALRILPKLSLGWQGRRLVRQNTNGPSFAKHNMHLGAYLTPATFMQLGFVAYDILNDDDLDMIPVYAIASQFDVMGILKLRVDVLRPEKRNPEKKTNLDAGLEFDLGSDFKFSTGGMWNTVNNQTFITLGLGWVGPRLSFAYAYKNNINVAKDISHNIQLWVPF